MVEDQELADLDQLKVARQMVEETGSMITGLIRSTEKYVKK